MVENKPKSDLEKVQEKLNKSERYVSDLLDRKKDLSHELEIAKLEIKNLIKQNDIILQHESRIAEMTSSNGLKSIVSCIGSMPRKPFNINPSVL